MTSTALRHPVRISRVESLHAVHTPGCTVCSTSGAACTLFSAHFIYLMQTGAARREELSSMSTWNPTEDCPLSTVTLSGVCRHRVTPPWALRRSAWAEEALAQEQERHLPHMLPLLSPLACSLAFGLRCRTRMPVPQAPAHGPILSRAMGRPRVLPVPWPRQARAALPLALSLPSQHPRHCRNRDPPPRPSVRL